MFSTLLVRADVCVVSADISRVVPLAALRDIGLEQLPEAKERWGACRQDWRYQSTHVFLVATCEDGVRGRVHPKAWGSSGSPSPSAAIPKVGLANFRGQAGAGHADVAGDAGDSGAELGRIACSE